MSRGLVTIASVRRYSFFLQEREKIRLVEFRKQALWAVQVIGRFFVLLKVRIQNREPNTDSYEQHNSLTQSVHFFPPTDTRISVDTVAASTAR